MKPIYYFSEEPSPDRARDLGAAFPEIRFGVGPARRSTVTDDQRATVEAWLAMQDDKEQP